jgi:hypothetical protein
MGWPSPPPARTKPGVWFCLDCGAQVPEREGMGEPDCPGLCPKGRMLLFDEIEPRAKEVKP